jgi:two-component system, cell cycle response regulator
MIGGHAVILIDPDDQTRDVLIERLRMQGYKATAFRGPVEGAVAALSSPPSVVIADLWMCGISGVQLTRLLRAEPATERVPVILRGPDNPRNRFWSERAGAAAYVVKGRMGELVRAIARSIPATPTDDDGFFTQLQDAESAIRDRIAAYLDAALFESVLAAEVRALSTCGAFDRLFDLLTQFISQVMGYRWLALLVRQPPHLGLHTHPSVRATCEREAREALSLPEETFILAIEDEDAAPGPGTCPALVRPVEFGRETIATIALSVKGTGDPQDARILDVIARELGGPLRMAMLVEEAQHAATTDPLTGIMNRRAFVSALDVEQSRSERHGYPMSLLLLDVDHFKAINDEHGHATGDQVLATLGRLLAHEVRKTDFVGRWGGEEFVVVLSGADEDGARIGAERIRRSVEAMETVDDKRNVFHVTVSIGISCLEINDNAEILIDRADRAMYQAKASGRNKVVVAPSVLRRTGTDLQIPAEIAE